MPLEELIFHVNICTTSWYPLKVGIVFGFLFLLYSAWSAWEDTLFWKCVSLGKEGKQGWWNRVCLWLPLCWGLMVSYSCHHVCHHGNWFPRASAWSWFGLVLKSPCSFAVWHAVIHLVEAVLLWLMWKDSRCKADPGSATACGSCEVPGRVLPERVICPHRPFSFQSDTTTVRSSRTTLAHQSYLTAASVWQLLSVFISRSGVTGSEDKCWLSYGERAVRLQPSVCHWHTCSLAGTLPEHQQCLRGPWASAPGRPRAASSACRYCRTP